MDKQKIEYISIQKINQDFFMREREREREREVCLIVGSEEDEWEELQCRWKESKKEWDALGGWVEKKGS